MQWLESHKTRRETQILELFGIILKSVWTPRVLMIQGDRTLND